jgi:preprotein translocase subunit Sec63
MDGNVQVAVIIVCCVAGYAAVSVLIDALRKTSKYDALAPTQARENEVDRARTLLGVGTNATAAELGRSYHEMLAKYHPDKTQHLGIEFQRLAEEKTQGIIRAYELLKSHDEKAIR